MTSMAVPAGGRVLVNVVDGTRLPFPGKQLQLLLIDGGQNVLKTQRGAKARTLFTDVPLSNNLNDSCRIIASAPGYLDAGLYPVPLRQGLTRLVSLMLIPKSNEINFGRARWKDVKKKRPDLARVLSAGASNADAAERRYSELMEAQSGEILACLLNLTTAMEQAFLARGTPFTYLRELEWNLSGPRPSLAADRMFGWADVQLKQELEAAEQVFRPASPSLHPGATMSFKQVEFGEANLHITLHENDRRLISGVPCFRVEVDIDYFHDPAAHLLLEVAVNAFNNVTDPRTVYVMRWIAGQRAGIPEFDPLYTILPAA